MTATTWTPQFVRQPGSMQPRLRLFCFAYAGGSTPAFAGWGQRLGPEIEVLAAHPRGRGMRFREMPDTSVASMVSEFLGVLRRNLDLPFAFYGHSLGGLLAYELTLHLQAEGLPLPEHLFVGASVPPHLGLIHEEIHHLPDQQFVDALQERYSGIPAEVMQEPELLSMFLPALKADFTAYERYRFRRTIKVQCPLTAFTGASDPGLGAGLLDEWERHTASTFRLHTVPGDHFFLTESMEFVLSEIRMSLGCGERQSPGSTLVSGETG